jgi:hypothetical protein
MAQAFGVADIFEKDALYLMQEIELKQHEMIPPPLELPPRPIYDARLMTESPNAQSDMNGIIDMLEGHIKLGLKLTFDEESWYMHCGKKSDSGTIRMPLRDIVLCADKVLV